MGVADLQIDVASLQGCSIADAGDVQGLREPFRHAGYGVVDQGSRKPVHRPVLGRVRGRSTITLPCSCLTSIPRATGTVSSPLGPFTLTLRPESSTLTAQGISTGAFPILDTATSLVDEAEDFAADAPAPGLVVCQDPLGGREYRHPEPVEHTGDVGLLAVDPAAGAAHPSQAGDAAATVGAVLQGYNKPPLDPAPALGDVLNVA